MSLRLVPIFLTVVISVFASAQSPSSYENHLLPLPAHLEVQSGRMPVDARFGVALEAPADPRLGSAISRFVQRLENRTTLELPHAPRVASESRLIIRVKSMGHPIPQLGDDESYSISITPAQAVLQANESVGVIRGLETLLQLLESDTAGYYWPAVTIDDKPRFPWRGLHIDVSRHFEPVEVIKRELDGLAAVKMNVFHWHLSDDQGFRVESKRFPKLTKLGSDGEFYTQEQVKDVVAYAAERGIRVIPEFDIPGHSTAWFVGYPQFASGPGPYQIERRFGIFDPTFNPADEKVYKFFDQFFGEMSKLFPDAYMHIGGDETKGTQWDANAKIRAFKKRKGLKDNAALQAYFNSRIEKILAKHGKKMVGWDEILHPDLPKDIVVQSWRGEKSLNAGAKQGYRGLLSAGYYLDHGDPASVHYKADPVPVGTDLTPEQAKLVLGGEACMWSEHIKPDSIDSRIWPRLAAIAERFWSPQTVQDADDMYRRLDRVSVQLEELGLQHEGHTERMLRQILGTRDTDNFLVFANTLMAPSLGMRARAQRPDQLSPFTHLADAVVTDPPSRREFSGLVDGFLSDTPKHERNRAELTQLFASWRNAAPMVTQIIATHPNLQEVAARASEFDGLGQLGQEALTYLQTQTAPPPEWVKDATIKLNEAAKPKGSVRFAVVDSLRNLVQAATSIKVPVAKVADDDDD